MDCGGAPVKTTPSTLKAIASMGISNAPVPTSTPHRIVMAVGLGWYSCSSAPVVAGGSGRRSCGCV